jgi:nucleotide-binding universal stress UspA family protein
MLDKMLYAVDFSEHQRLALPCLARLGDAGCSELLLLHITNGDRAVRRAPALLQQDLRDCLENATRAKLDEWTRFCEAQGLAVSAVTTEADLPWVEIRDFARRNEVSLVVLGPREASQSASCAHFLMHAHLETGALLLLKTSEDSRQECYGGLCGGLFSRVLLATDWSDCALRAEEYLAHFQKAGVEEVIVAHVSGPEVPDVEMQDYRSAAEKRLAQSCRSLEENGVEARSLYLSGDPAAAIAKAAETEKATLIVMGSTGKSVSLERLVGSVSERVAHTSLASVLLVY